MAKRNGTLRNVGIVVGILMALASASGIIWTFGKHSGGLDRVKVDVVAVKENVEKTTTRVKILEEGMIRYQSDMNYVKRDIGKILEKIEGE